jgi:hypothetical protein
MNSPFTLHSRLISNSSAKHTTAFLSQCADRAVLDYLLTGALPPEGAECDQDLVPFTFSSAANGAERAAAGRARLLPAMVPDALRPPVR